MITESTLATVPSNDNPKTQEEKDAERRRIETNDAESIRKWELMLRSHMLNYSNSLLRREDGFLLERNILETIVSGPYSSSDRLTNPQLASENPSLLYRASEFLSRNPFSSIISVTCLTALPSALACASSVTEDLAKYREDLCFSYLLPSVGVALIFSAFTFAAPTIEGYFKDSDDFLRLSRQYRANLGRNVNEINAPNNDGDQVPVPRAPALVPTPAPAPIAESPAPAPAPAPAQDPAPAPRAESPAPAQVQVQDPATILASLVNISESIANSGNALILTSANAIFGVFQTFMAGQGPQNSEERPSGAASGSLADSAPISPRDLGPDRV